MRTMGAEGTEESASDVVGDGTVSQMMFCRDKLWRAMLSWPADCEGWLHGEIDAYDGSRRHREACLGVAHRGVRAG